MKIKSIIIQLLCFTTINVFGQFVPEKELYKWGCTISVNDPNPQMAYLGSTGLGIDSEGNMRNGGRKINKSYSLSIIPKYYINNEWVIRFEYGITRINLTSKNTSISSGVYGSSSYGLFYDTIKQKINRYIPGIQWNFFTNKRIQSYGGINLPFIQYGAITRHNTSENRNITPDTLVAMDRGSANISGGFATGIGVFAGFNVFIKKYFSFGAEFSTALLYYNVGNKSIGTTSSQLSPNTPWLTTTYTNDESYKGTRFTKIISSFNITFWL